MDGISRASIVVTADTLSERYIPNRLPGREAQIAEVTHCLSPALKKRRPMHLWLHGKPGTGKTGTILHVLEHLRQRAGIRGLLINCWERDTLFEILDEVVFQLRILRAEEHRTSVKLEKLRRHLGDQPFILVLDEFDQVRPRDGSAALYNLCSLGNVGLVCISNAEDAFLGLEERVRSRLNPRLIHFAPYSRADLVRILADRADGSLAGGAWRKADLERIARMSGGDARVAIRALRDAAAMGEDAGRGNISLQVLESQWQSLNMAKQDVVLKNLTEDHRMLYRIVAQRQEVLSGELYQEYVEHCAAIQRKPLAPRTFSNYANRLVRAGLVTSEQGRVKGKVRLFRTLERSDGLFGASPKSPGRAGDEEDREAPPVVRGRRACTERCWTEHGRMGVEP